MKLGFVGASVAQPVGSRPQAGLFSRIIAKINLWDARCLPASDSDTTLYELVDCDVRIFCTSGPDELGIDLEYAKLHDILS